MYIEFKVKNVFKLYFAIFSVTYIVEKLKLEQFFHSPDFFLYKTISCKLLQSNYLHSNIGTLIFSHQEIIAYDIRRCSTFKSPIVTEIYIDYIHRI